MNETRCTHMFGTCIADIDSANFLRALFLLGRPLTVDDHLPNSTCYPHPGLDLFMNNLFLSTLTGSDDIDGAA